MRINGALFACMLSLSVLLCACDTNKDQDRSHSPQQVGAANPVEAVSEWLQALEDGNLQRARALMTAQDDEVATAFVDGLSGMMQFQHAVDERFGDSLWRELQKRNYSTHAIPSVEFTKANAEVTTRDDTHATVSVGDDPATLVDDASSTEVVLREGRWFIDPSMMAAGSWKGAPQMNERRQSFILLSHKMGEVGREMAASVRAKENNLQQALAMFGVDRQQEPPKPSTVETAASPISRAQLPRVTQGRSKDLKKSTPVKTATSSHRTSRTSRRP